MTDSLAPHRARQLRIKLPVRTLNFRSIGWKITHNSDNLPANEQNAYHAVGFAFTFFSFYKAGESQFLRKISRDPLSKKSAKTDATTNACGGPDSSASTRFYPARRSKPRLSHDLTPFREVSQVFSASRLKAHPALQIFQTKHLHFAYAPFPRFSASNGSGFAAIG